MSICRSNNRAQQLYPSDTQRGAEYQTLPVFFQARGIGSADCADPDYWPIQM